MKKPHSPCKAQDGGHHFELAGDMPMMPMTRNSEPSDPEGPRIALRCRGIVHRTRRASSTFYLMLRSHGRSKSERPCEVWPPCPEAMQEPHENTEYSKNMPKQQLAQKVPVRWVKLAQCAFKQHQTMITHQTTTDIWQSSGLPRLSLYIWLAD